MVVQGLRMLKPAAADELDVVGAIGGAADMDTNFQNKRGAEEQGRRDIPDEDADGDTSQPILQKYKYCITNNLKSILVYNKVALYVRSYSYNTTFRYVAHTLFDAYDMGFIQTTTTAKRYYYPHTSHPEPISIPRRDATTAPKLAQTPDVDPPLFQVSLPSILSSFFLLCLLSVGTGNA